MSDRSEDEVERSHEPVTEETLALYTWALALDIDEKWRQLMGVIEDLGSAVSQVEADEQSAISIINAGRAAQADLTAQIKNLQDQLANGVPPSALAPLIDSLHTSSTAIEQVLTPPVTPVTPAPALPLYNVDGDVNDDAAVWQATAYTDDAGRPLFTNVNDTAGQPPTADGAGGIWHVYVGVTVPPQA